MEMISSEVNSKKLKCNFDNLPEQNSTEVRHFWLNVKDEKQREFSRKYISCPKCSYRQVDCSLYNPAEDMSTINWWFSAQCPKMKKKQTKLLQKFFFLERYLWTRRKQFRKSYLEKTDKRLIFFGSIIENDRKPFSSKKNIFTGKSFRNWDCSFDIYSETILPGGGLLLAQCPKMKKDRFFQSQNLIKKFT